MKDFINVYDNAVSSNDCKSIIKIFEDDPDNNVTKGILGPGEIDLTKKNCTQLSCSFGDKDIINPIIIKTLSKYTPLYLKDNPELDLVQFWNIIDNYNIQKYNPKEGYFVEHCENNGYPNGISRMMVWMIYLNTVTDDGGTYFTNYDRTTDAVEGRLVIWPAFWTHTHRGVISNTQTKYIATGWYGYAGYA